MRNLSETTRLSLFVIYTIIWEFMVWGPALYFVYFMGASAWLLILAVIMSGAQFQPRKFGIETKAKRPEEMDEDEFKQYKEALKLEIELEKLKDRK